MEPMVTQDFTVAKLAISDMKLLVFAKDEKMKNTKKLYSHRFGRILFLHILYIYKHLHPYVVNFIH